MLDAKVAAYRRLGHAVIESGNDGVQLFANDRLRPTADSAAFAGGSQTGDDALLDQGALVLRQRSEHLEQELARGRCGVQVLRQRAERHLLFFKRGHNGEQVRQRPTEPI